MEYFQQKKKSNSYYLLFHVVQTIICKSQVQELVIFDAKQRDKIQKSSSQLKRKNQQVNQNKIFYCIPYIHRSLPDLAITLQCSDTVHSSARTMPEICSCLLSVQIPFLTVQPGNQQLINCGRIHSRFLRKLKDRYFPFHYKRDDQTLCSTEFLPPPFLSCYGLLSLTFSFEKQTFTQQTSVQTS